MVEHMYEIVVMNEPDKRAFSKAAEYAKKLCAENQWAVGVGEMALGAAVLAWGVQSGHIHMGTDVAGTKLSDGGLFGATAGTSLGGIGASILGSIGVAGAVTFGIPALALIGGGAAIFGLAGYAVGDIAQKFFTPPAGFGDFFFGASIAAVGVALMIDGARRVVTDKKVLALASSIKDGVIQLAGLSAEVIANSMDELQAIIGKLQLELEAMIKNIAAHPDAKDAALGITTAATATAGTLLGGGLAAGSVTVLGSHGLGAVALSLGLVAAPAWPVIAGGAAGLAVGLAAWKGVQHYRSK
jgi:hypothetical protein